MTRKRTRGLTSITAHVEDGIELVGLAHKFPQSTSTLPQPLLFLEEPGGDLIVLEGRDGGLVQRCFTAPVRRDSDVAMGAQDLERMGELGLFEEKSEGDLLGETMMSSLEKEE